jgi:hypothetical protein
MIGDSRRYGCGRLRRHCAPKIAVNIVNRIFIFFDEDRSPDNSDGISIEPPMQSAMDAAITLQPELSPSELSMALPENLSPPLRAERFHNGGLLISRARGDD